MVYKIIMRSILWLLQSFIYLVPLAFIVIGVYIFACFFPDHFGLLSFSWVLFISFIYIKYNRWY